MKQFILILTLTAVLSSFVGTAKATVWDSILSNKDYYDPTPNLIAWQANTTNGGLSNPTSVGDSTTWSFGQVVNGQWEGTAVGNVAVGTNIVSQVNFSLSGRINADGAWQILFTDTNERVSIGVGTMELVNGVWMPLAQTVGNPTLVLDHWAYNIPYDPSTTTPPPATDYVTYPSVTSDNYSWIIGTTWKIQNSALFGTSDPGTLTFSGFNNGHLWGSGTGPSNSMVTSFTNLGSVTPTGNILLGFLHDTNMSAMWGTINTNAASPSVMNIADYGFGTTNGISNGDSATLTLEPAPEPSAYALFGLGAIGMLMVLRTKKTV